MLKIWQGVSMGSQLLKVWLQLGVGRGSRLLEV